VIVQDPTPVLSLDGPELNVGHIGLSGVRGQELSFTGAIANPGSIGPLVARWNFGDGTVTSFQAVTDPDMLPSMHTYAEAGEYTVTLTVKDQSGVETSLSRQITISRMALQHDPLSTGKYMVAVGGTTVGDDVTITGNLSPDGSSGSLTATVTTPWPSPGSVEIVIGVFRATSNGFETEFTRTIGGVTVDASLAQFGVPLGSLSRMALFGQAGDDDMQVSGNLQLPAWMYGDAGDDRFKGGAGHDVILGGIGNDLLQGGGGRDLLIGGLGADRIVGNADDDILIAGFTLHDRNQTALNQVMAEWTHANRANAERVAALTAGVEGVALNQTTVSQDGEDDLLTGSAGQDWFFFDLIDDRDKVTDLKNEAFIGDLDWLSLEI
jgi:PKD repeat protein